MLTFQTEDRANRQESQVIESRRTDYDHYIEGKKEKSLPAYIGPGARGGRVRDALDLSDALAAYGG